MMGRIDGKRLEVRSGLVTEGSTDTRGPDRVPQSGHGGGDWYSGGTDVVLLVGLPVGFFW